MACSLVGKQQRVEVSFDALDDFTWDWLWSPSKTMLETSCCAWWIEGLCNWGLEHL